MKIKVILTTVIVMLMFAGGAWGQHFPWATPGDITTGPDGDTYKYLGNGRIENTRTGERHYDALTDWDQDKEEERRRRLLGIGRNNSWD